MAKKNRMTLKRRPSQRGPLLGIDESGFVKSRSAGESDAIWPELSSKLDDGIAAAHGSAMAHLEPVEQVPQHVGVSLFRPRPRLEPSPPPKRVPQAAPAKATKPLTKCPYCNAMVREDRLNRHIKNIHPDSQIAALILPANEKQRAPAATSEKVETDRQRALIRCPDCGQNVRADRLEKHVSKAHKNVERNDSHAGHPKPGKTAASRGRSSRTFEQIVPSLIRALDRRAKADSMDGRWRTACPFCKQTLTSSAMADRHMRTLHAKEIEYRYALRSSSTSVPSVSHLTEDTHDPRDAGKYLGYMTRENGRFGSLPLYDGYDDEDSA